MDNVILTEAFKELKLLEEESFDISSNGEIEDAKEFLADEAPEEVVEIADVYADEESEMPDSYMGKVILECNVCHSKIFEDADNVDIDEENEAANMEEECPYCFSNDGYKVIGQVAPFGQVEEDIEVEEEIPEEPVDDEIEEPLGEVEDEEEIVEESLDESLNESVAIPVRDLFPWYQGNGLLGKVKDAFVMTDIDTIEDRSKNPAKVMKLRDLGKSRSDNLQGEKGFQLDSEKPGKKIRIDVSKLKSAYEEASKRKNESCQKGDCKNDALDECDLKESAVRVYDDEDNASIIEDPENPYGFVRARKNPKAGKDDELEEDFKDVSITTDDSHMQMTSDEDGKVTVTTEPIRDEFEDDFGFEDDITGGDEMIAPVDDETIDEIEGEEEPYLGDEEIPEEDVDIDIDEFDEEGFDELGESYLKKVYENVNSFKTTKVKEKGNKLQLEGIIGFKSGANKKTSFIFEAKDINSKGKIRFIGENKEITRGKKSFTVAGKMSGKKFMCESLNYNYHAKDETGKSTRLYGTIKRK